MNITQAIIPALIVIIGIGLLFVMWAMTKRYKRIPPNAIGVIFGRRRTEIGPDGSKVERGFRLVTGGGVFVMPILEEYQEMSTEAFQLEIEEQNIPTMRNVGVHIQGVATCRISAVPEQQANAVQAFLGKSLQEIGGMIREVLRGHLRSIVGKLEIEELLRERSKFNEQVVSECSQELSRLGITILTLVIQDVKDNQGYIEALGKRAVAEQKRDAEIATAKAESETKVQTSEAVRLAAEAENANLAKAAEAKRQYDLQVAENKRLVDSKMAEAEIAGALSKTRQEQNLRVLEAERDAAAAEAQVKVHEKEALANREQQKATLIVKAETEREAAIINAEAQRKTAEIGAETKQLEADGIRAALVKKSEGEAQAKRNTAAAEAEATKVTKTAEAEGTRATLLADAEGNKAKLLAEAEGEKQKLLAKAEGDKQALLAQAEGKRQALLAEAEGTKELAEALARLDDKGKLLQILDRLPGLIKEGGIAGEKIVGSAFAPIGNALGNIGEIRVLDFGSNGSTAKGFVDNMGMAVPNIVTKAFAALKVAGVDATELLKVLKIDTSELAKTLGAPAATVPDGATSRRASVTS